MNEAHPALLDPALERRPISRWAVLAVALAAFIWGSLALTLMPAVNHDEVMLNFAAREWQLHGRAALLPLADFDPSYQSTYYWQPPGHLLIMRAAYGIFGFSIATTRGVSLFFGAALAAALFALAFQLTQRASTALVAVAIFLAHNLAWWLPRSGRMDDTALLFGVGALLCWTRARSAEVRPTRAIATGLLIGAGAVFHVMAAVFAPALWFADAWQHRRFHWRNGVILAAGALLPLAGWIAWVFARGDGDAWLIQFVGYQLGQRIAASPVWARPWEELVLLVSQNRWTVWLLPVLAAGAWQSRRLLSPGTRAWLSGGFVAAFAAIAFATEKGTGAYSLYWYVWFSLLAAAGMTELLRSGPAWRRGLCAACLLSPFAWQLFYTGIALYQRRARDPVRLEQFFTSHVTPDSVVLGPEDVWYGVDAAHATLRIWSQPDPRRHDYYVTYAGALKQPPAGFHLVATLPDIAPKIFGHYFSHAPFAYDLWASNVKRSRQP